MLILIGLNIYLNCKKENQLQLTAIHSSIKTYTISNANGMRLEVLNYGATITALHVPNAFSKTTNVVVGFKNMEDYNLPNKVKNALFLGSSIGRFAGRISNGGFTINETFYPLYTENNVHLHGGKLGFDKQFWKLDDIDTGSNPRIKLSYVSTHLEEGYPGNLAVSVTYQLLETNGLKITYKAKTDKTTHVNLTNHSYFNLNGNNSIKNHELCINSDKHIGIYENLIPNGEIRVSKDTIFDLSNPTLIESIDFNGFDDTFVLTKDTSLAATLISPFTGIKMQVYTNQPAVVVYTPKQFDKKIKFRNSNYSEFPAICFETQKIPDAPNQENFGSTLLEPGDVYKNETHFEFTINA